MRSDLLTAVIKAWGCESLSMENCTIKTPLEGGSVEKDPLCGSTYLSSSPHIHPSILPDIADTRAEWEVKLH